MNARLLLILSVLPSILLGAFIYKNDKVEKEPKGLLIKLFLGGIGSVVLTLFLSTFFTNLFPILDNEQSTNLFSLFIAVFIGISLIEETSKYFFLKVISWKSKEFCYVYDGIVYAVFVSLGFATIENILYVFSNGIVTAIMRAILSVPAHAFFGIMMGLYYGMAKKAVFLGNKKDEKKNKLLALLIPTILHGIFDYCLFANVGILYILYFIFVIGLYIKSFSVVKKMSVDRNNFSNNDVINVLQNTNLNDNTADGYNNTCSNIENIAKYCTNCGAKIKENDNFCQYCGSKVK